MVDLSTSPNLDEAVPTTFSPMIQTHNGVDRVIEAQLDGMMMESEHGTNLYSHESHNTESNNFTRRRKSQSKRRISMIR
jgi:hypothetical protein